MATPPTVSVQVLGRLRLIVDGAEIRVDGVQRRLLLALLCAQRGTPRNADWLATYLWPDQVRPTDATTTIRVYISRLRRLVGQDFVTTEPTGYSLGSHVQSDAQRAGQLADAALRAESPDAVAAILLEVLSLWTGPSFDEFRGTDALGDEVARCDRLRLDTAIRLADIAAVHDCRRRDVIAALARVMVDDPDREDLTCRLAVLQARVGASAEALRTIDRLAQAVGRLTDVAIDVREAIEADDLPPVMSWQRYALGVVAPPTSPATPPSQEVRLNPAPAPRAQRPFLGRAHALGVLDAAASSLGTGMSTVFIVGQPGIGKSELISRFAAAHPEIRWAFGGHEPDLPVPLLGIRRALPGLLDRLSLGDVANVEAGDRLVDDTARLLLDAAGDEPLGLVLEDIHDADTLTLIALRHLQLVARGAPLLLVLTLRDTARAAAPIRAIADRARRQVRFEEIVLHGLGVDDCAEVLRTVSPALAVHAPNVLDSTRGNPFLVHLLATALQGNGDVHSAIGSTATAIADLVGPQLADLSEQQRAVLEVAAAVGRTTPIDLLDHATAAGRADTIAVTTALRARGLLVDDPTHADSFGFPHELLREYILSAMHDAARRHAHAQVAAALEALPGLRTPPLQIAMQWARSTDGARSAPHFRSAAVAALGIGAFTEALDAATQGASWCDSLDAQLLGELHELAAQSLVGLGRLGDADDHVSIALGWAKVSGDESLVGRIAAMTGGAYLPNSYDRAPSEEVRAALVDIQSPRDRSMLLSQLVLLERSAHPDCEAWAREATQLAEAAGDLTAQLSALHATITLLHASPEPQRRLALAKAGMALAVQRPHQRVVLGLDAIGALVELGRLEQAAELIASLEQEQLTPLDRWWVHSQRCLLAAAGGRLDEAEALAIEGRALGESIGVEDAAAWYFAQIWAINLQRGTSGALHRVFAGRTDGTHLSWRAMAATELLAAGDDAATHRLLDEIELELPSLPRNYLFVGSLAVAHIAASAARHPLRASTSRQLRPLRHLHAVYGAGCASLGPIAALLALP